MKTSKLIFFMAAMLLLGGSFAACNSDDPIPFTHYSLDLNEAGYWDLDYDNRNGSVVLVNSDEELQKYFIGAEYPPIDFSGHTLVLISGRMGNGISKQTIRDVRQLSAKKYQVDVEIILNITAFAEPWAMAILTDKLSDDSKIEVNVITN